MNKYPNIDGLILESPFLTCIKTVIRTKFTLWFDMFDNEHNIREVNVPTLTVHGKKDTVVPFEHGQIIFDECPHSWGHLWLENAGHNNIDSRFKNELFHAIDQFVYSLFEIQEKVPDLNKHWNLRKRNKK